MTRIGPWYYPQVSLRYHSCDSCETARREARESGRKGLGTGRQGVGGVHWDLDSCLECLKRVRERKC